MQINELLVTDIKKDLRDQIMDINLESISDRELINIAEWAERIKEHADFLTLEDEFVGATYSNLGVIMPKISKQKEKRGITLIKTRYKPRD